MAARRIPQVEQELLTFPEHMSSPCGIRVDQSLVFCVVLFISLFVLLSSFFWLFVLSVLPYPHSHCPFGFFELFLPERCSLKV